VSLISSAKRIIANALTSEKDFQKAQEAAFTLLTLESQKMVIKEAKERIEDYTNEIREHSPTKQEIWELTMKTAIVNGEYKALEVGTSHGSELTTLMQQAVALSDVEAIKVLLAIDILPALKDEDSLRC